METHRELNPLKISFPGFQFSSKCSKFTQKICGIQHPEKSPVNPPARPTSQHRPPNSSTNRKRKSFVTPPAHPPNHLTKFIIIRQKKSPPAHPNFNALHNYISHNSFPIRHDSDHNLSRGWLLLIFFFCKIYIGNKWR